MTLAKRISIQLATAISLMVLAYLMVLYQFISVQTLLEETVQQIRQVDTLSLRLFQLQHDLDAEILAARPGHPPDRERVRDLSGKIRQAAIDYLEQTRDSAKREIIERFLDSRKRMEELEEKLSSVGSPGKSVSEDLAEWKREAGSAHKTLVSLGGVRQKIQGDFLDKIDNQRRTTQKIAVFFVVVGGICLAAIWTYTRRNLLIPLRRLAATAEAVSEGKGEIRIADIHRRDEVGVLARAFQRMVEAVQNRTENLVLKNRQYASEIRERIQAQKELSLAKEELERRVRERTKELQSRNQDLETLLYVTSHDLREPLRAIRHFSTILLESEGETFDERSSDYLMRIQRGAARLDRLIEDILLLSRAQRMEEEMVEISGDDLVRKALENLTEKIEETGARILVQEGFPVFRVSPRWVTQALYNLVGNSLKFVNEGKRPEIEIAPYDGEWEGRQEFGFVVRDRGPGIPPEYAEQVFGLFRRAVGRDVEGTGAGLAIVKQVAERHGGRAWYEPREGGGSQFFMTLGGHRNTVSGPEPGKKGND